MAEVFKIGIADLRICSAPDAVSTIGLGSCVGIAIWDSMLKTGGLIHIMLPDSTQIKSNSNLAKFADTGVKELVRMLEQAGCRKNRMEAKIAGGAQMFSFQNKSELTAVGVRNVEAVKVVLNELQIPLKAEDTGGNYGRTVVFYPENGVYEIRAAGKETITI